MRGPGLLAQVIRGELVESVHTGHLVLLDAGGRVLHAVGDPDALVYPRSSLKPAQAVAMLAHGAALTGQRLALAAASHSGEPAHQELVRGMLADAGCREADLACPPAWPLSGDRSAPPSAVAMNCSGKHAGMLAAVRAAGQDIGSYTDPAHPFQRQVRTTIEALAAAPAGPVSVDGCGAPLFGLPLVGLARLFAAIATATDGPARAVATAMRAHPWYVGGTGRDVTRLMQQLPGLVAKDGAEGVFAAALPDGRAVALKVADGSDRARAPVLCAALARLGVTLDPVAPDLREPPVLGGGRPVGAIRACC